MNSKSSRSELKAFFNSSTTRKLKARLCDIGRRLWQREYVDGNGGNLAIRVGRDLALCTPSLVSKGFMKPEDMCLVDFTGRQLAGTKPRTSEILMHLQIMQAQPRAVATCHCHPPTATGFAVAGILPPLGLVSEFELFVSLAMVPYRTPGTPELGRLVAGVVDQHNTILLANHGAVSWSHLDLEDACFKMEILENYCRTVLAAAQLSSPSRKIKPALLKNLLERKRAMGIPDPRQN